MGWPNWGGEGRSPEGFRSGPPILKTCSLSSSWPQGASHYQAGSGHYKRRVFVQFSRRFLSLWFVRQREMDLNFIYSIILLILYNTLSFISFFVRCVVCLFWLTLRPRIVYSSHCLALCHSLAAPQDHFSKSPSTQCLSFVAEFNWDNFRTVVREVNPLITRSINKLSIASQEDFPALPFIQGVPFTRYCLVDRGRGRGPETEHCWNVFDPHRRNVSHKRMNDPIQVCSLGERSECNKITNLCRQRI